MVERDVVIGERDVVTLERDQAMSKRDQARVERDAAMHRVEMAAQESQEFISSIRDANF